MAPMARWDSTVVFPAGFHRGADSVANTRRMEGLRMLWWVLSLLSPDYG